MDPVRDVVLGIGVQHVRVLGFVEDDHVASSSLERSFST